MIYIANKKNIKNKTEEEIAEEFPGAIIFDITSTSPYKGGRILSPFYPHGNIPIPFTEGMTATCVESVWQGLKVFKDADVDITTFSNDTMKGIKRTARKYGQPLGHRKGVNGKELLGYFEARMQIYLPTYKWMLDNVPKVQEVIERLRKESEIQDIVLLDYNTNTDFRDTSKPLSHAGLVKLYVEGKYPDLSKQYLPMTSEEIEEKKKREKAEKKERKKNNKNKTKEPTAQKSLFD